jgi:hypothetical protein
VGPSAGLGAMEKRKTLLPPGTEKLARTYSTICTFINALTTPIKLQFSNYVLHALCLHALQEYECNKDIGSKKKNLQN